MKNKIKILFIILVIIGCVFLGINTRKANAISVTQVQTNLQESLSYMIETNEGKIVMIDGGSHEDSQHLEQVLTQKGGVVDTWFITIAHWQNFGALQKIIENGKIQINHIYLSFNPIEWYEKYEPDRAPQVKEFTDLIYSGEHAGKVLDIPNRFETKIDNLYITALNVKNPKLNGDYAGFNQSMVIKVDNTYKSMIFMGNIANQAAEKFRNSNLDQIDCDAVQVSNNGMQNVSDQVYKIMTPTQLFVSIPTQSNQNIATTYIKSLGEILKIEKQDIFYDTDLTMEIW